MNLKVPPLLVFLITALLIYALPSYGERGWLEYGLTAIFSLFGLILSITSLVAFKRANTSLDPRVPNKTCRLVTSGVFRYTRNPIYLALVCFLIAWTFFLTCSLGFLAIWGFISYLTQYQIKPEEKVLEEKFREDYRHYYQQVPRWWWK